MELELIILLAVAVGFWAGKTWATWIHIKTTAELLRDLKITNKDLLRVAREQGLTLPSKNSDDSEDDLEQIDIKVEKHGEMLYAFRSDNDAFLGQAKNREDLINEMATRLRNVRCTVVEGSEYMKP